MAYRYFVFQPSGPLRSMNLTFVGYHLVSMQKAIGSNQAISLSHATMVLPTLSACAVAIADVRLVHPDKLIRLVPALKDDDIADFIELAINFGEARRFIAENTKTSAGQHGVSGESVGNAPIPLPPYEEAVMIARMTSNLLYNTSTLKADLSEGLAPSTLRQAILAAAFRGELGV